MSEDRVNEEQAGPAAEESAPGKVPADPLAQASTEDVDCVSLHEGDEATIEVESLGDDDEEDSTEAEDDDSGDPADDLDPEEGRLPASLMVRPMFDAAVSDEFCSGFVALVGRPNVGKSTLVNMVVRARIAIVSPRPQTTRGRIYGIRTTPEYQLAFVDMPGYHKGRNKLGKAMQRVIREESQGADVIALVVDIGVPPTLEDSYAARFAFNPDVGGSHPVVLVGNKADLVTPEVAQKNLEQYRRLGGFASEHLVSAAIGNGLLGLEQDLASRLPRGPMLFPPDAQTDQDDRSRSAEIIREKVLMLTHQEVPHAVAVEIEEFRVGKTAGTWYVRATIHVEKESQKGIVVGKKGARLKSIGQLARIDLQGVLGKKIFLDLWVKVKPDWRERPDVLRAWGFHA